MMKLAALLLFTYSGTPCIYYGDEIGMDGDQDPDCRKCMEWDTAKQDRDLFSFYQKLIAVRKELPALRTGSLHFLTAEPNGTKLAFERRLGEQSVLVLLNNDSAGQTIQVNAEGKAWANAFDGQQWLTERGILSVKLPAYGYAILTEVE
ncbi:Cyclomaltodextrinase [compost metagenome]